MEKKYSKLSLCVAVTPAVDDSPILGERDASKLMGELIEAQNQAHYLGLALEIETRELDSITSTHQQPKARLLHVIYTFLRQTEPRPTWSAVVKALNSPAVGLPKIAKRIQEKYINRPTPMLPCSSSSAMTRRPINTSPEQAKVESPYALRGKRSQEQVSDVSVITDVDSALLYNNFMLFCTTAD